MKSIGWMSETEVFAMVVHFTSTVARPVTRRLAAAGVPTDVRVYLSLRSYAGDLTSSLAGRGPQDVLMSRAIS